MTYEMAIRLALALRHPTFAALERLLHAFDIPATRSEIARAVHGARYLKGIDE